MTTKIVIERVPRGDGVNADDVVHYIGPEEIAQKVHDALNDQHGIHGFYERRQRFDIKDVGEK